MKMNNLSGLIALVILSAACGNNQTPVKQPIPPDGWTILAENGYSIQYPTDWVLDKSGQGGTTFFIISQVSSSEDQFSENVNLIIQDLSTRNYDLNQFTEISEEQIKTKVANSILLESKRLNANGTEFQKVIYTGDFAKYNLTIEQYYWVRDKKAYVLTLTCETSQFDTYRETGEKILNSFRLNKN